MLILNKCMTEKYFLDALSDQQWVYLHDNHTAVWPIIRSFLDSKQGAHLPFFQLFYICNLWELLVDNSQD